MVGAVALRLVFTDETALYGKNYFPDVRPFSRQETPLIPEIVEEREISVDLESFVYDRFGRLSRIKPKGVFVDSYR
jgi:hypothetical protein